MTDSDRAALRECPFCGDAPAIAELGGGHWIQCEGCFAHGPDENTVAEAIAAWNTRTPGYAAGVEAAAKELDRAAEDEHDDDDPVIKSFAIDLAAIIRALAPAEPVGTDRIAFEAWLRTDGGKRAVEQVLLACDVLLEPPFAGTIERVKSSLWWAYVHGWNQSKEAK